MQFYKNHKVFDNSRLIAFCNDKVKSSQCFRFFLATIYIISFPGDVSTSLNMTIGCGCSHPCHSERKRGNPADRRTHQADNLAKLWLEFLSLL